MSVILQLSDWRILIQSLSFKMRKAELVLMLLMLLLKLLELKADVNRENRRLQSALADIEEGAKSDKIHHLFLNIRKKVGCLRLMLLRLDSCLSFA